MVLGLNQGFGGLLVEARSDRDARSDTGELFPAKGVIFEPKDEAECYFIKRIGIP